MIFNPNVKMSLTFYVESNYKNVQKSLPEDCIICEHKDGYNG